MIPSRTSWSLSRRRFRRTLRRPILFDCGGGLSERPPENRRQARNLQTARCLQLHAYHPAGPARAPCRFANRNHLDDAGPRERERRTCADRVRTAVLARRPLPRNAAASAFRKIIEPLASEIWRAVLHHGSSSVSQ